ncbi:SRP receptor beta subunit [Cladophialophora carrionii]|uniref:Signal recognition particle receptor subunit beta n=1 Tax=Cladophialophora carrionii TaxID=86049 RepID=A0A1C1C6B1_9EURO|nr:SRP receptor beta subunit [Cladophialophora carrionii]
MGWSSPDSWLTRLFSGDPIVILIALLVTIALPSLVHLYFYTQNARVRVTPTFLLLGPSGAGKTSLVSLLQKRSSDPEDNEADAALTRVSQVSSSVNLLLSPSIPLGSNKYRSENDVHLKDKQPAPYVLIDTPGHGKLRSEAALSQIQNPALRGVIFVVDSSVLDASDSSMSRDTAVYLHDTLLALQRRKAVAKTARKIPVLIAANKQDLFTALPTGAVRERLQTEIERVRVSKSKGLGRVGEDADADAEEDVLGGGGEEKFSFKLMAEEYGIDIEVLGGAVKGEEAGKGVRRWEEWIGGCL